MAYYGNFSMQMAQATDAAFRAWVQAIITAIPSIGSGWTQAPDAGQINPATVLAPTGVNQSRGTAVFQMTGTPTWYLLLEFGSGSSATMPSLWATVVSATNGASAVASGAQTSTRIQITLPGAQTAASNSKVFGYSSGLGLLLNYDSGVAGSSLMLFIERIKDVNGNDSDGSLSPQGVIVGGKNSSTGFHQPVPTTGAAPSVVTSTTNAFGLAPPGSGGTLYTNKISMIDQTIYMGDELPSPTIFVGYVLTDIPTNGAIVPNVIYNVERDYFCSGNTNTGNVFCSSPATTYMALRAE